MDNKKLTPELAHAEIEKWLSFKRVRTSQREAQKDGIAILVEAMEDGDLVLNAVTHELEYKLNFPPDEKIKELKFKPRLNDAILRPYTDGNRPGNASDFQLSYMAALTDVTKAQLQKLDTSDKRVVTSIVNFFF